MRASCGVVSLTGVIPEKSDYRSYYVTHEENLGCIVKFPWWRELDDFTNRSETDGRRSTSAAMLSSSRKPSRTIRIFSSAKYCLRVIRRISQTVFSVGSFLRIDFRLIFVPFGQCDEPEILHYENPSLRPKAADVRHG